MINWTLLQPRNLFVIGAIAIVAFMIFKKFSASTGSDNT